jgi:hypothetical protein
VRDGSRCDRHAVYVPPPPKAKRELEQPIKKRIQARLRAEGCACWIHNIDNRNLRTGLDAKGVSDLICMVPPHGVMLAIEIKRPKYSPSDVTQDQRAFLAAVRHFGGVSGIATCEAEALALVAEARQLRSPDAIPSH